MQKSDPAYPALSMKRVDISDDEFGRCFEVGSAARKAGKPQSANPYSTDMRWLAWKDGWDAANVDTMETVT